MAEPAVVAPPIAEAGGEELLIELPSLGADMDRGTLLEWHVAPGDTVARGDIIALVATDKADVDVEVWRAGTVVELLIETGVEIPVGTPILRLGSAGNSPTERTDTAPSEPTPTPAGDADHAPQRTAAPPSEPTPVRAPAGTGERPAGVAASPLARAAAAEAGIDLAAIAGSGPDGAVLARDVEAYRHPKGADGQDLPDRPAAALTAEPSHDRSAAMRRTIAARMSVANRDIPHYYLEHDVDLAQALGWLEERNASRPVAERVLPAALLLSAAAAAAAATPELNGYWVDDAFEPAGTVDLAVVVSLRTGGLVTPKIANADELTLDETMGALTTIVTAARRGSLRSSWLDGAGITVSSLGDRGVDRLGGVIFPPQVALVGAGGIRERPWVVDGAVVARPIMTISLAADHRASDGVTGSRFLTLIADSLENPEEQWPT